MRARRADWTPDPAVIAQRELDADLSLPRCAAARCERSAVKGGRCAAHFAPMRSLVAGMAGTGETTVSRRAFAEAMTAAGFSAARWSDLAVYDADGGMQAEIDALLDEATEALFAAGYRIAVGPRGGRYLDRRSVAA